VAQFFTEGFVVKRDLLPKAETAGAVGAVEGLVDSLARKLHAAGKITDLCEGVEFERRLIEIEKQFPNASVLLHKQGILPEGIADLWAGPTLLACARQLVGPDLAGHPVWNLRTKTPNSAQNAGQAEVPWHQDTAYLSGGEATCVNTLQATAWVPLVDATEKNGCMEVIRYGHRAGREVDHECCVGGTWYVSIKEGELEKIGAADKEDVILCDVRVGDVLFLNNVVPHRSLPNVDDHIRWSLDLRWQHPQGEAGFYGIKDPILMTKADDPTFKPNWANWAGVERTAAQMAALAEAKPGLLPALEAVAKAEAPTPALPGSDPFDTIIAGPWMARWPVVHVNRHTKRHEELELLAAQGGPRVSGWHADALATGGAFG
jgi:hypothetical protein